MFPSFNVLCEQPCCHDSSFAPTADVIHAERLDEGAEPSPVEPSFSEQLAPVAEDSQSTVVMVQPARNSIRFNKMITMKHMEIDEEVTRGIALQRALRCPELWTSPQEIRRKNRTAGVWNLSKRVSSFDIFLSHTWRTKGKWKVLALLMQSGWLHGLLGWSIGLAVMLCLRSFEIVSDPWNSVLAAGNQARSTPLSLWTVVAAELLLLIGLVLSPYFPFKTQMCFLDVACIHQGQSEMFERGICGIGGCLTVAKELRVLYTSQYLSSLWCVFELVGFRRVNPEGKLNFSPLFMEQSCVICACIMFCTVLSVDFVLVYTDLKFRQNYIALVCVMCLLLPTILLVHTMRFNYRHKSRLICDLNTFDVDNLICTSDYDREFIMSAVEGWYGSREAFNAFVQNDLRKELLGLLPSPHLPCRYAALILSSQVAWTLDVCLSVQKAGFEGHILLRIWISTLAFQICWFWFAFNGIFYLSDQSASTSPNLLLDCLKTLTVAGLIFLFTMMGFTLWIQVLRSSGVADLVCFTAFSLLLPFLMLNPFSCRRREASTNE
eukprot:Skav206710  [mRNA]  locus=scaffold99:304076:305722:+ [translate_table: standard]